MTEKECFGKIVYTEGLFFLTMLPLEKCDHFLIFKFIFHKFVQANRLP